MAKRSIEDRKQLSKGANKALDQNLAPEEVVRVIVRGNAESAMIATDRRCFIYKRGAATGNLFGNSFGSWEYRNLTGVRLETGLLSGSLILEGPGVSAQGTSRLAAQKSGFALALNREHYDQAREGVAKLRDLISAAQSQPSTPAQPDVADQLRKLGELRVAGIVTEAEFESKKAELLTRL